MTRQRDEWRRVFMASSTNISPTRVAEDERALSCQRTSGPLAMGRAIGYLNDLKHSDGANIKPDPGDCAADPGSFRVVFHRSVHQDSGFANRRRKRLKDEAWGEV